MYSSEEKLLSEIEKIAEDFGITAILPGIETCRALIRGETKVKIGIFGRFKAGKSSFLNSLAAKQILPVGVLPVTGTITEFFSAEEPLVEVLFLNGNIHKINREEIPLYVSEEKNPANIKGVAAVRIGVPELSEYGDIIFVDTPGIDSLFKHNTDTALNWLPKAGLAIIAVSADSPFSESDFELLEKIVPHCPRIMVLLTKADLFSGEEISKISEFIRSEIKKRLHLEIEVYPYSVRENCLEFKKKFIQSCILPLIKNPESGEKSIILHKVKNIRRYCTSYLMAAEIAAKKSSDEQKKYKSLIDEYRSRFSRLKKDFLTIYSRHQSENRSYIESLFISHKREIQRKIPAVLKTEIFSRRENLLKAVRRYNSVIKNFLMENLSRTFMLEKDKIEKVISESVNSFSAIANDFCSKLSAGAGEVLGKKFPELTLEVPLKVIDMPDIRISQAFDSHIELLWFLIPSRLLRKSLTLHFLERAKFEVEKNLTRMAMDIADIAEEAVGNAMNNSLAHVERVIDTADRILSASPDRPGEIKNAIEKLEVLTE